MNSEEKFFLCSVMTVHKVQQFHQNNFSALDDGHVGLNMLCKQEK
jgi:hypothetical protein